MSIELIQDANPETIQAAKETRAMILRGLTWIQDKQAPNQHILTIWLNDPYEPTSVQLYWEKNQAHITLEHLHLGTLGYIHFDGINSVGIEQANKIKNDLLNILHKHGGRSPNEC